MLSRSVLRSMRVLCLTMIPDGGAMTPALKQLGYEPYSLKSSFQQGHASTHPLVWSKLLDGKAKYDKNMFGAYDCFVGPPAAMIYDAVLRDCPAYTKVVLVEEPDKQGWADVYDDYMGRLQKAMKRASKNKITIAFNNMLDKMVVRGGVATTPEEAKMEKFSYRQKTSTTHDLRRALAAEDAEHKKKQQTRNDISLKDAAAKSGECTHDGTEEVDKGEEEPAELTNPRAVALELYEESVKMSVPPSRLLVYRYGDGWEVLCDFLEKPVPDTPFPPYDDGLHVLGNLQERIARAEMLLRGMVVLCVGLAFIAIYPRLGIVSSFFSELLYDYQVAFGKDNAGSNSAKRPSDQFEDAWRKRGGMVTTTSTSDSKPTAGL